MIDGIKEAGDLRNALIRNYRKRERQTTPILFLRLLCFCWGYPPNCSIFLMTAIIALVRCWPHEKSLEISLFVRIYSLMKVFILQDYP